jgi:hypothetical protein
MMAGYLKTPLAARLGIEKGCRAAQRLLLLRALNVAPFQSEAGEVFSKSVGIVCRALCVRDTLNSCRAASDSVDVVRQVRCTFRSLKPSSHSETQAEVIRTVLGVDVRITQVSEAVWHFEVT